MRIRRAEYQNRAEGRARYYNPVIGRFTQEDTYYGDGLNLYEYCRNNTITYKDPTGHNICATQRDLYHKYREEGMNPQEAYQKMRKDLGLDSKSGYKDSGVGNGKDPQREFDVISDQYIAQAKPPLKCVNKTVRTQMKATFEAAKKYERKVYYQFEGIPSQEVLDKLYEYSERYGVEVIIDTEPLEILN